MNEYHHRINKRNSEMKIVLNYLSGIINMNDNIDILEFGVAVMDSKSHI